MPENDGDFRNRHQHGAFQTKPRHYFLVSSFESKDREGNWRGYAMIQMAEVWAKDKDGRPQEDIPSNARFVKGRSIVAPAKHVQNLIESLQAAKSCLDGAENMQGYEDWETAPDDGEAPF